MSASRVKNIDVSGVRRMFRKAPENSIHLAIGQPDFRPAKHIIEALIAAVNNGYNRYGPVEGIPELREAVARKLRRYREDVAWENVIITSGATEALLSINFALLEEGDEVLIPDPGFIIYDSQIKLCGAKPVRYPLKYEEKFAPCMEDIKNKITPKTKAIIVNSPSNPTGTIHNRNAIKSITEIAEDHDLFIITDEVYDEIIFDGHHSSYLGNYDKTIYVNSFSKTYSINGWRLGYMASGKEIITDINKFHYYTIGCPNTPAQYAACAALDGSQEYLKKMVEEFKARRDIIVKDLNSIDGITCLEPKGTFYAFPKYDAPIPSEEMANKLLEAGLVCSPGTAFGRNGEGHLRLSFANSRENIKNGVDILRQVVGELL
jgi:aspartate aminotransferase